MKSFREYKKQYFEESIDTLKFMGIVLFSFAILGLILSLVLSNIK